MYARRPRRKIVVVGGRNLFIHRGPAESAIYTPQYQYRSFLDYRLLSPPRSITRLSRFLSYKSVRHFQSYLPEEVDLVAATVLPKTLAYDFRSIFHMMGRTRLTPVPVPDLELLQHANAEQLAPLSAGPPVLQTPAAEQRGARSWPGGKAKTPVRKTKARVKNVERIVIVDCVFVF